MAKGKLVLMGSGEIGPSMTKVHRKLLEAMNEVRAVNLDTPYGFQLNVPQMTQKIVEYFKTSLQTDINPLSFTNYEKSSGVERELFRQTVREANYVFAGPGSPSYALSQWKDLNFQDDLQIVLDAGGIVCFSSAAALTLGAFTAPIYEIYKAGADLSWLEGLNQIKNIGLDCSVIPHFNNSEGGNYDTSCCYLGLNRLEQLENLLPENTAILGIDEHSALIIDLEMMTLEIAGKGCVYWRTRDSEKVLKNGTVVPLSEFTENSQEISPRTMVQQNSKASSPLALAKLIEQGGEGALSSLTKLVMMASGTNPSSVNLDLLIESLLKIRRNLKVENNYLLADKIRDVLTESGITVYDTPDGFRWEISS